MGWSVKRKREVKKKVGPQHQCTTQQSQGEDYGLAGLHTSQLFHSPTLPLSPETLPLSHSHSPFIPRSVSSGVLFTSVILSKSVFSLGEWCPNCPSVLPPLPIGLSLYLSPILLLIFESVSVCRGAGTERSSRPLIHSVPGTG